MSQFFEVGKLYRFDNKVDREHNGYWHSLHATVEGTGESVAYEPGTIFMVLSVEPITKNYEHHVRALMPDGVVARIFIWKPQRAIVRETYGS